MKAKKFNDFTSVQQRVQFLLEQYYHLRDNDEALVLMYHRLELGAEIAGSLSFDDYGAKVTNRKLTKFYTIMRKRQLLMQHNDSLRGDSYKIKKAKVIPSFKVNKRD
jgi:hypothetical protein